MSIDTIPRAAPVQNRSRDAGVLVMGRILSTLADALLPLVLVRLLGKAEVGVLGSVLLLYQTIALVLGTDLPTALMYHMPGRPVAERRALAVQQAMGLLGFGLLASLLLAATGQLDRYAPSLAARLFASDSPALLRGGLGYLSLLALLPIGDLPARMLPNLLVIENRTQVAARFAVIKSIGNALFVLIPAAMGLGVRAVLVASSLFGLLQGAALIYFMRAIYRDVPRTRAATTFWGMLRFALPLGITDIVAQFGNRIDRYLVSAAFSAILFAEYYVGAFQIPVLTTIAYSVGTAYQPLFTEMIREGRAKEAIAVWRQSIDKVALIVVPCSFVFVVAAEEFMEVLFTRNYTRAASVFRWYALITAGRVTAFGSMIVAAGRPQYILRAAVGTLVANTLFSSLGLRLFGLQGPALGLAVAFVFSVIIYCHYIARALDLHLRETFPLRSYAQVVAVAALSCVPALLVKHYLRLTPPVFIGVSACTVLMLFCVVGAAAGLITRDDGRYLARWIGLKTRVPHA